MVININLTSNSIVRFEKKKILLPEKIELQFSSNVYAIGTLLVIVKNGNFMKKYKTTGEAIDITELCKTAGEAEIEINYMSGCEILKTWHTEKLLLCEIEGKFEAIPEIEILKAELTNVKKALVDINNLISDKEII